MIHHFKGGAINLDERVWWTCSRDLCLADVDFNTKEGVCFVIFTKQFLEILFKKCYYGKVIRVFQICNLADGALGFGLQSTKIELLPI